MRGARAQFQRKLILITTQPNGNKRNNNKKKKTSNVSMMQWNFSNLGRSFGVNEIDDALNVEKEFLRTVSEEDKNTRRRRRLGVIDTIIIA